MSADDEQMKLHYMQLITTKTDGLTVVTTHSEVRGESMEQCYEYTRKLHNGDLKSKQKTKPSDYQTSAGLDADCRIMW